MARFAAVLMLAFAAAGCVPPDPCLGPTMPRPAMPPSAVEIALRSDAACRADPDVHMTVMRAGVWSEPSAGSGVVLTGTIRDDHGEPLAGATIIVPVVCGGADVQITDETGVFHVELAAAGTCQISVYYADADGTTAPIELRAATTTHLAVTVDVTHTERGEI